MPDRSLFRKTNLRFMFEVLSDWDPLEGIFCVFFFVGCVEISLALS